MILNEKYYLHCNTQVLVNYTYCFTMKKKHCSNKITKKLFTEIHLVPALP